MPYLRQKTLTSSLKKDKWLLPVINMAIIIFGGFFVFATFVGIQFAISLYGGFVVAVALTLIFSPLAKNTMQWYNDAPMGFHAWLFAILIVAFTIFFKFVYFPRKQNSN